MKKLVIYSLVFILCLLLIFNSTSFAGSMIYDYFADPQIHSAVSFEDTSSTIYTILRSVAIVVASCMAVYISISYMLATPNKRAELKGKLGYYIAGVIFLAGLAVFLDLFVNFGESFGRDLLS